jgi:hypothetical protein
MMGYHGITHNNQTHWQCRFTCTHDKLRLPLPLPVLLSYGLYTYRFTTGLRQLLDPLYNRCLSLPQCTCRQIKHY